MASSSYSLLEWLLLRTGDVGRIDSGGYITMLGQLKEVIIRG